MPRYGDDQCVECGGIRVAKSTLCANCLVKAHERVVLQITKADIKIVVLKSRLDGQLELVDAMIKHGFKQNQENVRLSRIINELMDDVHGPEGKDG